MEEDLVCELTGDWQGADTVAIELYVFVEYRLHPPQEMPYPSMANIKRWQQEGLQAFYRQNPAIKELPDDPLHIGYLTHNFEPALVTVLEDGEPGWSAFNSAPGAPCMCLVPSMIRINWLKKNR